jgi:hypothetical protein
MLERQERTALILLVAVTGTVLGAHLIFSAVAEPYFASPFSNTSRDGDLVILEGRVEELRVTAAGGHLMLEVAGVPVFIPGSVASGLDLHRNDSVVLRGVVQTYRGKKEIVVESPGDVRAQT